MRIFLGKPLLPHVPKRQPQATSRFSVSPEDGRHAELCVNIDIFCFALFCSLNSYNVL